MDLTFLLNRNDLLVPWAGKNLPWGEEDFSGRMLVEHLTPRHDLGSRGVIHIAAAVEWIHQEILRGKTSRVLDLGCGPGLYLREFGARGHQAVGLDISPASVRYAKSLGLDAYEGDWRAFDLGSDFDLVTVMFSELNCFPREEAVAILKNAAQAAPRLILEVQKIENLLGTECPGRRWDVRETGPFSAVPHLLLTDHALDEEQLVVTTRFTVIDLASGESREIIHSEQGYRDDEWEPLLVEAGWKLIGRGPDLGPPDEDRFMTLVAERLRGR